jgi:ABC-type spermidine/putrescine transport system permease subunit II
MDLLILIAVIVIGYFCFNTSKAPKVAAFNATLIIPLVVMGLALLALALNSSVGKILGFIGLGIVTLILWAALSNTQKSEEADKNSDDS